MAAPYVFYGETVSGKYDPAQPGVIAIHATIDGKEVSGYVDAAKLWLEPPLDAPRSERYLAVGEVVAVHVLPSLTSPPALTLLQGEVVDAVGVLNSQGQDWVKARFNVPDRPRYGFIRGERNAAPHACFRRSIEGRAERGSPKDSQLGTEVLRRGPEAALPKRVLY